jgi:hypothetical protein
MAKLHSYYVTNAPSELKYMFNDIPNNQYEKQVEEAIHILQFGEDNELEEDEFIDEENEFIDEENEVNNEEINLTSNEDFNNCFDFSNIELCRALEMDISVVIEPYESDIEHGEIDFDSNELLNTMLPK